MHVVQDGLWMSLVHLEFGLTTFIHFTILVWWVLFQTADWADEEDHQEEEHGGGHECLGKATHH